MKTVLKTAPTVKPITLREAKEQLSLVTGQTDHDRKILQLMDVATAAVEQKLRRRLLTQTWYLYLDSWTGSTDKGYFTDGFIVPLGQLQSITSIKYKDTDGDESTWSNTDYIVDTDNDPGQVVLGYSKSWPTTNLYPSNPITVEFVCGYGAARSDIPHPIRQAIMIMTNDLFQDRESRVFGAVKVDLKTVEHLLMPYVLWEG